MSEGEGFVDNRNLALKTNSKNGKILFGVNFHYLILIKWIVKARQEIRSASSLLFAHVSGRTGLD